MFQMCYCHQPTCLSFGLPVFPVYLSVYRATLEFKSSGCAVSNNLNYDSSPSLSVSVKVIPKFLIHPSAIASNRCVRG